MLIRQCVLVIGAFSKRGVEPFFSDVILTMTHDNFYQVKMVSQEEAVCYLESVISGHSCASGEQSWCSRRTFAQSGTSCATGRRQ